MTYISLNTEAYQQQNCYVCGYLVEKIDKTIEITATENLLYKLAEYENN